MKPTDVEKYNEIKPMPKNGEGFIHIPGVYCKKCGDISALYSYSVMQPHGTDENKKPFYNSCFKCDGSDKTLTRQKGVANVIST